MKYTCIIWIQNKIFSEEYFTALVSRPLNITPKTREIRKDFDRTKIGKTPTGVNEGVVRAARHQSIWFKDRHRQHK